MNQRPYEMAINCLRNIIYCKSPVHKLKIFSKCITLMHDEINKFYKTNNLKLKNSNLIESDDLISIVVYITA